MAELQTDQKVKRPLKVFVGYALLNVAIYALGQVLADGWNYIDSSEYRTFLYFVMFTVWPVIIGISVVHVLATIINKKIAITSLKFALIFGLAGPLILYLLIQTSSDPLAGMAWIACIIYYIIFALAGFALSCVLLWMRPHPEFQSGLKKFILPSCLLLSIIMIPLGIYIVGTIGLNHQIKQLRNQFRPVTWTAFYNKYPITPESAPEYQLMQKALKIMETIPRPIASEIVVPDERELSPEESRIAAKVAEFQKYMHQLLEQKPYVWRIQPFLENEPRAFLEMNCIDYKYLEFYLKRQDYVNASSVMDLRLKARIVDLNNVNYGLFGGADIKNYNIILNSHKIPEETLQRWLRDLDIEESDLYKARTRAADADNVRTIVDPIAFQDGFCLHSQSHQLPLCLRFINPCWRWCNLQLIRKNENIKCMDDIPQKRIMRENYMILFFCAGISIGDVIFATEGFYQRLAYSFIHNQWTDPDNGYFQYLAELRILKIGIAAELYFRKYRRIPEKLEQVCPEFIADVPRDPYTLKPLLYIKLADGNSKIYSTQAHRELILRKD